METYNSFMKKLFINYIIGSTVSIVGVGGLLIFTTIDLSKHDKNILVIVLFVSTIIMFICDYVCFQHHIAPIKRCFQKGNYATYSDLDRAYKQIHRFPMLSGIRILGPHLWGLATPAIIITIILIANEFISLSYVYIFYAMIGAILIASMHAMIEYFQTTIAIERVIDHLQHMSLKLHQKSLSLNGKIYVSVKTKFQLSALLIGAFPLLLFSLVTQILISYQEHLTVLDYWTWATLILLVAIALSLYGAWLLYTIVKKPLETLEKNMKKIETGNLTNTNMINYYSDEFSHLVNGFNLMVAGIKEKDQLKNQLLENFISTLAAALDARDPYTAGHSIRVAKYAHAIGKKANFSEEELRILKQSALLHDIGKIGIPDEILLKETKLTDEEYEIIKSHPVIGVELIKQVQQAEMLDAIIPGIRSHHERWDGKGYPDGLKGHNIPILGRIIAVADAFDAMTSDRPYRRGMTMVEAMNILKEGRFIQWDGHFVDLFEEWFLKWDFREIDKYANTQINRKKLEKKSSEE